MFKMLSHMQDARFLLGTDTHLNGDIMSYYTNDIDGRARMIGTSLPKPLLLPLWLSSQLVHYVYYQRTYGHGCSVWIFLMGRGY